MGTNDDCPTLLTVDSLCVQLGNPAVEAVKQISFAINRGEILGMAGESGSGKSVSALSLTRLLPVSANPSYSGVARLYGIEKNLLSMSSRELATVRGGRIGYVFQEPSSSFNPVYTIKEHLLEVVALQGVSRGDRSRAISDALESVGIPATETNLRAYPGDFSGGMLQRLAIACALIPKPDLLIADEPTTALDTTTQKRIVELLRKLNEDLGMAILFISHDLALLKQIAPKLIVMKDGVIVEQGSSSEVLYNPVHPYTQSLVEAIPKLELPNRRPSP